MWGGLRVELLWIKKTWACATRNKDVELAFQRVCHSDWMQTGGYSELRDERKRLRRTQELLIQTAPETKTVSAFCWCPSIGGVGEGLFAIIWTLVETSGLD